MIKGIGINCDDEAIDGRLDRLQTELERAHRAGFDAYELTLSACNVIRCGRIEEDEISRLAALLDGQPLHYTVHAPLSLRLTDRTGFHERVFLSCLQATHRIRADVMVYHSAQLALWPADQDIAPLPPAMSAATESASGGRPAERALASDKQPAGLPDAAALAESWRCETEALKRVSRQAEKLGVTVAVENRDPHLWEIAALYRHGKDATELTTYHQGMRPDLIAEQVRAVDSPNVGICLDVGHAYLAAPYWTVDFLAQIRAIAPYVRHVHWHDNFGRLDDRCESLAERLVFGEADNHLPPGWGKIPLAQVLAALQEAGYAGWLTIEIRSRYAHLRPEICSAARAMLRKITP